MHRLALACLGFVAVLSAQHGAAAPAPTPEAPSTKQPPPPVHAPQPALPPAVALQHLRAGNSRFRLAAAQQLPVPEPTERPAGAGRYVAAVVVCADAGVDPASLFGVWPKDLLVLSTPAARLSAEDVAVLEQAVAAERLSLCIVLTHADCTALRPAANEASPAAQQLSRRGDAARDLANRRHFALEKAQALLQVEAALAGSDALKKAAAADTFRLVPGSVTARTGEIVWHSSRADEMRPAPIK
jgi:carbonic anhydrase